MRDVLHGLALIPGVAASLILVLALSHPRAERLAAVFPPWWTTERALMAAAGAGRIEALGRLPATVIVRGDPARLAERLRLAGAVFTFDSSLSIGCEASAPEIAP